MVAKLDCCRRAALPCTDDQYVEMHLETAGSCTQLFSLMAVTRAGVISIASKKNGRAIVKRPAYSGGAPTLAPGVNVAGSEIQPLTTPTDG
jgi:hypothetical protein